MAETHINITFDLSNLGSKLIDLRVPTLQPTRELIINILQTLHLPQVNHIESIRVKNKNFIVLAHENLANTAVAHGDVLEMVILSKN